MNVVKVIRNRNQAVKLIRSPGQPVKLVRPGQLTPIKLVNNGGVVSYGGARNAAELPIQTDLQAYYTLQKQC